MEKPFVCTDCKGKFATGAEFSEHFQRALGTAQITGCKQKAKKTR